MQWNVILLTTSESEVNSEVWRKTLVNIYPVGGISYRHGDVTISCGFHYTIKARDYWRSGIRIWVNDT